MKRTPSSISLVNALFQDSVCLGQAGVAVHVTAQLHSADLLSVALSFQLGQAVHPCVLKLCMGKLVLCKID